MSGIKMLIGDSYGIYIPQTFTTGFDREKWNGISDWAWETIFSGPDNENYWDAWNELTDNAKHTDENGNVWRLYQDGDLWAFCDSLMTDEEYENFFGEQRWAA